MTPRCLCKLTSLEEEGYSRGARRELAGGNRKFPHRLSFNRTGAMTYRATVLDRMSISGVQVKVSLKLHRGKLQLTDRDGEYILKPSPEHLEHGTDVPANEHLTMQLASQIFGIETAACACIRFSGGELAYITRRFDRRDGHKIPQEDFCQLSGRSPDTAGRNFKYQGSYEELGRILRNYCPAYAVEIEKLYRLVVFNYVFSNGDAHLKNFSIFEIPFGDHILTPAYDLLCTSLHLPNESRLALELFDDDFETPSYTLNGFHTGECFLKLAERYGLRPHRAERILATFAEQRDKVLHLIEQSFLTDAMKGIYQELYEDRLRAIAVRG